MVTGGGIVVGLPTKKLAREPSKNKNSKNRTMSLRNALREMMEERASASNDRDPSLECKNIYWSMYKDENGEMLTSGEAIFDEICKWSETQGTSYKLKRKNKNKEEIVCDAYKPLRKDAIVAHELAIKFSVDSFLRIPENRREEFLQTCIEWAQTEYTVAAYAIHFDEGYKDEGAQYKEALEPSGLWVDDYIRIGHIQLITLSLDGEGEFVGQHLFDKKGQNKKEKSFAEYMQEHGFDVVDNRNFKPERIDDEFAKLVSQGVDEVTAEKEAKKREYQRCYYSKKAKKKARNEYGVNIPEGAPRNQFGELSREQAQRRLLDVEAQEDYRKEQLEQYTAALEEQAKDKYRAIVDKATIDASNIRQRAKEDAIDYKLQAQQIEERARARVAQTVQKANDELYEAERKRKQAEEQAAENKRVSQDLTAAITKYNEDKAALERDRAALEQEKAQMREDISLGQQYRAERLERVNQYEFEEQEEERLKVAR